MKSRSPPSSASPPPLEVVPASSPHYNKAIIILRKIISVCIVDDGNDGGGGVVGFFQDVIVGTIMAMVILSMVMWLDFVGVVHFDSAHSLRNSAFQVVNDPETLAGLEDSTGLKFMKVEEFSVIDEEINKYVEMSAKKQVVLDEKSKMLEESRKEVEPLREELKKLESKLELDKFCGSCAWKGRQNCNARLAYAMDKYKQSSSAAKAAIMQNDPQCKSA